MNDTLVALLRRVAHWSPEAQDEAVRALKEVERRHAVGSSAEPGAREAKLARLRETIERSIANGGGHTAEDMEAMIGELSARSRDKGR